MIDFKYHLVSLISVFMALAIGIVLGAGPLQQSIGNGLQEQVSSLRSDKESLQSTSRSQQDLLADDDSYLTAATPQLVGKNLSGQHVVLLGVQGAAKGDLQAVQSTLRTAGATVEGTVTVADDWAGPGQADARTDAAAAAAKAAGAQDPGAGGAVGYLNNLLAETVATRTTPIGSRPDGEAVLRSLGRSGLITVQGNPWQRGTLTVLVAGPQNVRDNPTSAQKAQDDQISKAWLGLVQAVGGQAKATVLAGPRRSDQVTSLVAALRASDDDRTVAGVDDVDHPLGRISTALVAKSALDGTVQQCGTADDAQTVVPQLLASPTSTP